MSAQLVILGGCGGIGRALVEAALQEGYEPTVLDLPASIEAHQPEVPALAVDATDPASLAGAVAQLADPIAGFVNLCGFMSEDSPLAEIAEETWQSVLAGNLGASFHAARAIVPKMGDGGSIVMIGSGLGHFARPGYGPYAISKAGIAAMTRQLALELAPRIRVNCVAPSAVDTAFLRGGTGRSDEDLPVRIDRDAYAAAIPLKRIARPEDVTGPILFLLSKASSYMTGQTLHVNGGAYMP